MKNETKYIHFDVYRLEYDNNTKAKYWAIESKTDEVEKLPETHEYYGMLRWGKSSNPRQASTFYTHPLFGSSKLSKLTHAKRQSMIDKKLKEGFKFHAQSAPISTIGEFFPVEPGDSDKLINTFPTALRWKYTPPSDRESLEIIEAIFASRNYYCLFDGIYTKPNRFIKNGHTHNSRSFKTDWNVICNNSIMDQDNDYYSYTLTTGYYSEDNYLLPDLTLDRSSQGRVTRMCGIIAAAMWLVIDHQLRKNDLSDCLILTMEDGTEITANDINKNHSGKFSKLKNLFEIRLNCDHYLEYGFKRKKIKYTHSKQEIINPNSDSCLNTMPSVYF